MGKRALNPADAHRKLLRRKELKKNKEDRKRIRQVAETKKETARDAEGMFAELEKLKALEKEAPLDKASQIRKQTIQEKLDQINDSRKAVGLPPLLPPSSRSTKTGDGSVTKWYHPTFNPHGPKKPDNTDDDSASDSDSSASSVSSSEVSGDDTAGDAPPPVKPLAITDPNDLLTIEPPQGEAPGDAQFYHILELPEIRIPPKPQANQRSIPNAPPPRPAFEYRRPAIMPPYSLVPPPLHYPAQIGFPLPSVPSFQYPIGRMNNRGPMTVPQNHFDNSQSTVFTPTTTAPVADPVKATSAVISAAPQLRDLQKELVTMVPAALLKRKKTAGVAKAVQPSDRRLIVNATPDVAGDGTEQLFSEEPSNDHPPTKDDEYSTFLKNLG
ncbi:hypothetical protein DFJ73DRAFT_821452 [Zopfochytrium polystomum]|nr:hypothetical protein DFJ73DRAFT_821452 [Zopfochytrium polystomum]